MKLLSARMTFGDEVDISDTIYLGVFDLLIWYVYAYIFPFERSVRMSSDSNVFI